ncbi:hypothetical protein [Amphritea sp. HPY]|uniref:hypothetical protein n=1 Tax=Amphritea sp. HPY TaxID=3421652 RepID=UPI003D7D4144
MKKLLSIVAATTLATASIAQAEEYSGEVSIGYQHVFITNEGLDGSDDEFDESANGSFVYLGGFKSLDSGAGLYADLTIDHHKSTETDNDDDSEYYSFGLHYIVNAEEHDPWGVFGFYAVGKNNGDDDDAGPVWGLGAEKRFMNNYYLQGGYMEYIGDEDNNDDDTMHDMIFARLGGEKAISRGSLTGSMAVGYGDFDEDSGADEKDNGTWVQFAFTYEAPINETINWYVGYQADWLEVDEPDSETESGLMNSVQLGIAIPFGDNKTPFKTPNFRAPLTNAGHLE